ncbi:hypothetical protein RJG79_05280 [Mycoplasmatota bacterium WC44]
MLEKNNEKGNVLVNSLMALVLAGILLTSISTTTISSYIIHDELFDWSTQLKEARLATQIVIVDSEHYLMSTEYSWNGFRNHLIKNTGSECELLGPTSLHHDGLFPIECTVGEVTINTDIIINFEPPSLYDYVIGTNGDLYLNGTSLIGGNLFAENIYLSNHTLNGSSALSLDEPISIKPLLDKTTDPVTQYNYPYFNLGSTIGTNIYTNDIFGCHADEATSCYSINSNNIMKNTFNSVLNSITLYTHENNHGYDIPTINTSYAIGLPILDLSAKVDELFDSFTDAHHINNYGDTIDPYSVTTYNLSDDILCYTNFYNEQNDRDGYNCKNKNYLYTTSSNTLSNTIPLKLTIGTSNFSSSTLPDTVFADPGNTNYSVTVDSSVTHVEPSSSNLLFIDGDLVVNNINSSLKLGGTIIVSGDIIINGSIDTLILTGTLYSFGTININLTSSTNGLSNGDDEFGYLFAREHIIINSVRDPYGMDSDISNDFNMNGYFYADGSILIESDTFSSFNLNGGLFAAGNTDTRYPQINIDGYDIDFDGIMINSYSGEIIDSQYSLNKDPYYSRFVLTPHKATASAFDTAINQVDVPNEFKTEIGEAQVILTYKEVSD